TFTYAVSNTGTDSLANVTLIDDAGTIGITSDDFVPAPVTITVGGNVFNVGDTNKNGLLDKSEVWVYSATQPVARGAYTNYARVSAVTTRTNVIVKDEDPANIFGAVAQADAIRIQKAINAVNPLAPTTLEDGDTAPGQSLLVGTNLVFTYLVTNTGQTDLVNPVVMDDAGTPGIAGDDFVAVVEVSCGVHIW